MRSEMRGGASCGGLPSEEIAYSRGQNDALYGVGSEVKSKEKSFAACVLECDWWGCLAVRCYYAFIIMTVQCARAK